jgi:RimJ/RimL family protein N-acetyltransferase
MKNIFLRPRTIDTVKIFWEKTQDETLEKLFPFYRTTLDEAIEMYYETLKPNSRSYGQVIYVDETYIGDVWCYSIDEINEKQAFISIVIFDKLYWGKGIGKYVLKTFCNTIFQRYSINKLCAFTYKTNLKSVKALESVGFNIIEEFDEDGVSSYYLEMINRLISNNQNKN